MSDPFTGDTVEVYHFLNDKIGGELTLEMPKLHVGDDPEHGVHMNENVDSNADGTLPFVLPWAVYGDEVLLEWDYAHDYPNPVDPLRWPSASTGERINPSEHFTIYTSWEDLADLSTPTAHFRAGFSRISPWWPWMRMGGHELAETGVVFGRMFSHKGLKGPGDIPPKVLGYAQKHHPDYLEPCSEWDDGFPIGTWEAYARAVPPEQQP